MSIGDHAISDRAISAPEDFVSLVATSVGRVVLRDRPVNTVELEASLAGGAQLIDFQAFTATVESS